MPEVDKNPTIRVVITKFLPAPNSNNRSTTKIIMRKRNGAEIKVPELKIICSQPGVSPISLRYVVKIEKLGLLRQVYKNR